MRMTRQRAGRLSRLAAGVAAASLLVAACGGGTDGEEPAGQGPEDVQQDFPDGQAEQDAAEAEQHTSVSQSATLAPPNGDSDGITYDEELAPEGAELTIDMVSTEDESRITLTVADLLPERGYAVHAHTDPCGPDGDDSGPHYQDDIDPEATEDDPSTDPEFANPENEIWLDVETNSDGDGTSSTEVPFGFTEDAPESVVVHEEMETATGEDDAGTAGGRVACLTVPFGE